MSIDDARKQPPADGTEWLDIRVGELRQLFNAMDPAPFRERDIDPNAETYIVEWAQEVRAGRPLGLVVHLARERAAPEAASMLRESVDDYFRRRAVATRARLRRLFRVGRVSLVIGLAFLVVALALGEFLAGLLEQGKLELGRQGEPGDRRLGRVVAAARDLPVRLVADPRRGADVRPAGRDGRQARRCRSTDRGGCGMTDGPARSPAPAANSTMRATLSRGIGLFALWIVLMPSAKPADLVVGALAAAGATWVSLRLLPPASGRVRFAALLALLPRFLWQSLLAGIDVARRAFAPRMRLAPGFVTYRTGFPRGQARNNFATITSLMPGSVPVGDGPDTIEFHCLDASQPVVEQMAEEERLLAKALVPGERHG